MDYLEKIRLTPTHVDETPIIYIDLDRVKDNLQFLRYAFLSKNEQVKVFYALKANYFRPIIEILKDSGIDGLEVISDLEKKLANELGFSSSSLIYNGVCRDKESLHEAIQGGLIVNIDSIQELKQLKRGSKIGLRIHPHFEQDGNFIQQKSKLGIDENLLEDVLKIVKEKGLYVAGVHFHLFSNLDDEVRMVEGVKALLHVAKAIESNQAQSLEYIDVGGGFKPRILTQDEKLLNLFQSISQTVFEEFPHTQIFLEPGRFLVSDAVYVLSKVRGIKKNQDRTWAILDIGTNYLIPAPGYCFPVYPYDMKVSNEGKKVYFGDVICSPAGVIDINDRFTDVSLGDRVWVLNAGAYTSVMKEQFVMADPRHIFLKHNKVVSEIMPFNTEMVKKYYAW